MKIYVFGNQDDSDDKQAIIAAQKLQQLNSDIEPVYVKPNADLPFVDEDQVVILDVMKGISVITVIDETKLHALSLAPRSTVHDFDLGFQLRYLQKIGKLGKVSIVGLPYGQDVDYTSLHSILRKLVAQDMHGS